VFRIVGCANTTALACWTAILDSDGVISHSSALGLFGVPGFQVKPIEVTRLRGGRRRPSQGHHRPTESGLESRLEHLARQAGVGGFVRQVDTGGEDIWLGRVDFRHCELPVVVFVDSERYHSALIDVRRDEEQRAALDAAGFVVVRVTDVDVWNRGPEVIAKLRGACERARAAELAVQIR
jgi:very-short-patch-repair endonuclease